jgi:hypothetical protein
MEYLGMFFYYTGHLWAERPLLDELHHFSREARMITADAWFCYIFDLSSRVRINAGTFSRQAEGETVTMDSIVMIMFGSVLCTMTALNFIELRRIRKKVEGGSAIQPSAKGQAVQ